MKSTSYKMRSAAQARKGVPGRTGKLLLLVLSKPPKPWLLGSCLQKATVTLEKIWRNAIYFGERFIFKTNSSTWRKHSTSKLKSRDKPTFCFVWITFSVQHLTRVSRTHLQVRRERSTIKLENATRRHIFTKCCSEGSSSPHILSERGNVCWQNI